MANIQLPELVRKAAGLFATEDDASVTDTILSVGLTVLVAQMVVGVVVTFLPILGGTLALPVTAGIVAVVANRLA